MTGEELAALDDDALRRYLEQVAAARGGWLHVDERSAGAFQAGIATNDRKAGWQDTAALVSVQGGSARESLERLAMALGAMGLAGTFNAADNLRARLETTAIENGWQLVSEQIEDQWWTAKMLVSESLVGETARFSASAATERLALEALVFEVQQAR